MDRFLAEVHKAHNLRDTLKRLSDAERAELVKRLHGVEGFDGEVGEWWYDARDSQLPPRDLSWCWLFLGGRGTGKTHAMSSAVHMAVRAGLKRIHIVGPTAADIHDVMLAGSSGIMHTNGRDPLPRWIPSKRRLEWPNGAIAVFFSGEEPDSLRGPQCELAVIDEIARCRYAQEIFDMTMLGLRLGDAPRLLVATTPRATPFMKKLVSMENIRVTHGSTYDNAKHLSPGFLKKIKELYEGTRLGRQELQGQLILDPISALFKPEWIRLDDVPEELIEQASVGVDPSGGSDVIGIVVGALLTDGRFAVLADRSIEGSPAQWGDAVVRAHDEFNCDDCAVEINFGGQMCIDVVKHAAQRAFDAGKRDTDLIRIKEVTASRGKVMRAEPISLLYEKNRVLHRRGLDQLEMEMMSFSREWDRAVDGSPNRLDAMTWVLTRLSKIITQIPIA